MLSILLVALCAVLRVVPHPPNFAPVGATAVLAGRTMKPAAAIALVLAAMFTGDVVLSLVHGYPLFGLVTAFVYAGFVAQALLGWALRARRGGALIAAALGALSFFLLSNLGVWLAGTMYPNNLGGLIACYVVALPFLGGTLLGDLLWTAALALGYHHLAARLEGAKGWLWLSPAEVKAL